MFQLGIYAPDQDLGPVVLRCNDLKTAGPPDLTIPAAGIRCFNLGGTDFMARPLTKELRVAKGRVQPLWLGVEIPRRSNGKFMGRIYVSLPGAKPVDVQLQITVSGEPLEDWADSTPSLSA